MNLDFKSPLEKVGAQVGLPGLPTGAAWRPLGGCDCTDHQTRSQMPSPARKVLERQRGGVAHTLAAPGHPDPTGGAGEGARPADTRASGTPAPLHTRHWLQACRTCSGPGGTVVAAPGPYPLAGRHMVMSALFESCCPTQKVQVFIKRKIKRILEGSEFGLHTHLKCDWGAEGLALPGAPDMSGPGGPLLSGAGYRVRRGHPLQPRTDGCSPHRRPSSSTCTGWSSERALARRHLPELLELSRQSSCHRDVGRIGLPQSRGPSPPPAHLAASWLMALPPFPWGLCDSHSTPALCPQTQGPSEQALNCSAGGDCPGRVLAPSWPGGPTEAQALEGEQGAPAHLLVRH